jgi:hypothetical protein
MNSVSAIEGKNQSTALSVVLIIGWLATIGVAEWFYAVAEPEPPAWDALTYTGKAFYVWDAISHGKFLGLFDGPFNTRPPGTVLMCYPFGFSSAYGPFYFRSVFIPLVLVVCALYIVGYFREMPGPAKWLVAILALAIGGMPILFQFQGNEDIAAAVTWGLVDNFLAGVAAVAIASAHRSVRTLSPWWAIAGSLAAAFCLLIKPAGLLVMALVAPAWMLLIFFRVGWSLPRLWREPAFRRLCLIWLMGTAVLYGLTIVAAFSSEYLGAMNLVSGAAALAILQQDFAMSLDVNLLLLLLHTSFGYPLVLLIALGLCASVVTQGERGSAAAAALCLTAGIWFWIFATGISQVRYFLPFGVMTFILVVPSLLRMLQSLPTWLRASSAAVLLSPTAAITLLLLISHPPASWQRSLGINLSSAVFRAEDEQALGLLNKLQKEGIRSASVHFLELTSPARSFGAVLSYWNFANPMLSKISVHWPVSWESATTVRLSDIAAADYAVFAPIRNDAQLRAILESRTVSDFGAEKLLVKAWFSTLTSSEGVDAISETSHANLKFAT